MSGVLRLACVSVMLAVAALPNDGKADQASKAPLAAAPRMVAVDDQLFDVTAAPHKGAPYESESAALAAPGARSQGVTLDNDNVTWLAKFNAWEGGVIPIEFASDVPQSNRADFMRICNSGWGGAAYVSCIPRTSQAGFLRVTDAVQESTNAATCFSVVGQPRRLTGYEIHLGPTCWSDQTVYHELGHALGFVHEHQRSDRDNYVTIDTSNVPANLLGNFTRITSLGDAMPPYDFLSIMHYRSNTFAADPSRPTIVPRSGYGSFASTMGSSVAPTQTDRDSAYDLYIHYFRNLPVVQAAPTNRFDRTDFLDAMERLNAFYYSRMGLARPEGLAIDGRPDFQGIATWIFDLYLGARSAGLNAEMSFGIVVVDITQTPEWKLKHAGWTPGSRGGFNPSVRLDRNEFLDALQRLDAFYAAPEGLRRPNGLSISGGPDFAGIAAWVFDVYLNERLSGSSANVAWTRVMNAIQATDEWKSKH